MAGWADLIPLIASVVGEVKGSQKRGEAEALLKSALARFDKINPNALEEMGPGATEQLTADPALEAAQRSALAKMGQIESSGGLTLEDQAALAKVQGQVNRTAGANMSRIQQGMDARGAGSSGANLALQMQSAQDAGERANEAGMNTSASAQRRYLQSILQRGQMAGQMSDQNFNQRSRAAQAKDVRDRYNNGLKQQKISNQIQLASGMLGPTNTLAGNQTAEGNREQQWIGNLGQYGREVFKDKGEGQAGQSYSPPPLVNADEDPVDEWGNPYPRK